MNEDLQEKLAIINRIEKAAEANIDISSIDKWVNSFERMGANSISSPPENQVFVGYRFGSDGEGNFEYIVTKIENGITEISRNPEWVNKDQE